ncbi:uncharacterized protein LTR77_005432 [Saxophila tyrrhenica]|uniref:Uncharacterized protein n=1 Tax=Saxophila tyrrhenica TaxID=1690608 RepID=A0AAV9P8G8_9PEZI|nr:hypothetical protein LTR77_005432 [Saxophila tyrrhenica]
MADATTPSPPIKRSVARGDVRYRRTTVTGTPPPIQTKTKDRTTTLEVPRPPTSPTTVSPKSDSKEKRAISSNILHKFNILRRGSGSGERPPSRELRPPSREKEATSPTRALSNQKSFEDDFAVEDAPSSVSETEREGTISPKPRQVSTTRKRTGSLRKAALLGGRRNVTEGREREAGFSPQQAPLNLPELRRDDEVLSRGVPQERHDTTDGGHLSVLEEKFSGPRSLKRQQSYETTIYSTSSDNSWTKPAAVSAARLSLLTGHQDRTRAATVSTTTTTTTDLGSPLDLKSPTSQFSYTSTESDDPLTFPPRSKPIPAPISSSSTSYFPLLSPTDSQTSFPPTSKSKKRRSPLSRTLTLQSPPPTEVPPHDYTETETWGWILLLTTWLTFTVGMGSCLGLWSWAWDVGDTPYAPPDLEDDPTLPVVGYYPALMVLSGVVAWVWITVAWVGMKYFRHAKIEV